MIYTTTYFEQLAESYLRKKRGTLEKAIITESERINEWHNFTGDEFDIFLSHSFVDRKIIFGVYLELYNLGYNVYVDWIKDPELNRSRVTNKNADRIRQRLYESKSLFYATTSNSKHSRWMPWELGFMDGLNSRVAILPMKENHKDEFHRLEYLELYPYIEKAPIDGTNKKILWVCENDKLYTSFNRWMKGNYLTHH